MTGAATLLFELVSAAGGTLALTFIVALAASMLSLLIFYLGSSVVVLERFAREARSFRWIAAVGVVVAFVAAVAGLEWSRSDLGPLPTGEWLRALSLSWLSATAVVAVAMGATALALRSLAPSRLAQVSVVFAGLGYAVLVGATGRLSNAVAPVAVCAVLAAGAAWLRRHRGRAVGETERALRLGTLALVPGVPLAWALPFGQPELALLGSGALALLVGLILLGLLPLATAGLLGMRRTAEWFIAVRYLVAKRRQVFISAITAICVLGIAAGVWLIITVLSVMNGFEKTWRDEIVGNRAHLTIHSAMGGIADYQSALDVVRELPDVVGASPYLDADAMIRGASGGIHGVRVRGVDPATVGDVTDLPKDVIEGSVQSLASVGAEPGEDPGILIGHQLQVALGAQVGEEILLVLPYGGPPTPLGPAPRLRRFRVAGIFETSFFQYDEVYTYVSLTSAQALRGEGDLVDGIEVRTTDFYRSQRVGDDVRAALGFPYYTRDWKEFFPAFFQALKTERVMMFLLLAMIMVVAAFAIVATLIMMIMEKSSDIAILKAMGARDGSIERIFAIEGTLIGVAGTALGVVASIAVTRQLGWIQERIEWLTGIDTLPASVYQFSTLPSEMDAGQMSVVVAIAMVLSLGATLLPSRQGSRLDPVEALRYE
ncbi:MAG: lipoprotein-releasing ABC transporter permease subunit [Proteobacteria bacterium]|nr:lipoprotein-releasing ABC transporter permease subunit [Pseudomonadota bacterium]